jgi:ABC-2 type transport system ATP-binding protein
MYAIEAHDLTRRFGKVVAVDRLNLQIRKGEIFGFLGPNGAGKSTTIKMLCGILKPTSGQGFIGGLPLARKREQIKEIIGYMSQSFGLYADLTVEENIRFYAGIYLRNRLWVREKVDETIESIGLAPYRGYLADKLSGGWKQRLALACAVVHEPEILFLDEPTAGIDPVSRRFLWDELYKLSTAGITLFVTTHYMEEAERCNRISFIHQGRLVACDTPEGIKANYMTEEILRIVAHPIAEAFALLKGREEIDDVNIYGDELHAVVRDPRQAARRIESCLRSAGIEPERIEEIFPSIEDVFVALSKKN